MQYSTARRFFEAFDVKTAKLETVTGERPGLWLYIHGPTHHWAISAAREAGRLLPAAEAFSTVRALLEGSFADYPATRLAAAWEAAIYPDHGWGGKEGQVTDRLFRKKYEFARDEGRVILQEALTAIASRIVVDPTKGVPIIVFNPLSWPQTGPVKAVAPSWVPAYLVHDAEGRPASMQATPAKVRPARTWTWASPIWVRRAAIRVHRHRCPRPRLQDLLSSGKGSSPLTVPSAGPSRSAPRGRSRATSTASRLAPGGVAGLYDKELGREVLDTRKFLGFEVFTMRSVGNGAGEFGRVQQPTMEGFDSLGRHKPVWQLRPR